MHTFFDHPVVIEWLTRQRQTGVWDHVQPIVVGCSGGPDSVFLTLGLSALVPPSALTVVLINHGLRETEVLTKEQHLVQTLAQSLGAKFYLETVDVQGHATRMKISVEAAGHHLRRRVFSAIATQQGAKIVAVGHHADDSVETLLLKWQRGAKSNLGGLKPEVALANGITLVRPLLTLRKHEIEAVLTSCNQPFAQDKSNQDMTYARNQLRVQVLPQLQAIIPNIFQHLTTLSQVLHTQQTLIAQGISNVITLLNIQPTRAEFPVAVLQVQSEVARHRLLLELCQKVYQAWDQGDHDKQIESKHLQLLDACVVQGYGKVALPCTRYGGVRKGFLYFLKEID